MTNEPSHQPAASSPNTPPTEDEHDESLVRWFLSLTPRERLDALTNNINAIQRARAAANAERLRQTLAALHARYRGHPDVEHQRRSLQGRVSWK